MAFVMQLWVILPIPLYSTVNVALISCSNGYGHIRRLLLLSQELISKSNHVVLFAPLNFVKKIKETTGIHYCPDVVDFDTETNIDRWLCGEKFDWYKRIPNLENFDIVVSDNLIDVLEVRDDAWLSGSFFWHEIIHNFPLKLKNYYQNLLLKHNPRMISSSYFSQSYLSSYVQLYEVGLYGDSSYCSDSTKKKDALISCGIGGKILEDTREFIRYLSTLDKTPFIKVWVEPSLYPKDAPSWMVKATFTTEMFNSLLVSIIRPGVGTVIDSLLSGVKIFSFFEQNNFEMQKNLVFLEEYKLGTYSSSIEQAWLDSLEYINNRKEQNIFHKAVNKIEVNGEKKAAEILLSK